MLAQDIREISGQDDRVLLRFASAEGRVVATHDLSTMIPAMRERMRLESRRAPTVLVPDSLPAGTAVDDLLVLDGCATQADWAAGVIYAASVPAVALRSVRQPCKHGTCPSD